MALMQHRVRLRNSPLNRGKRHCVRIDQTLPLLYSLAAWNWLRIHALLRSRRMRSCLRAIATVLAQRLALSWTMAHGVMPNALRWHHGY